MLLKVKREKQTNVLTACRPKLMNVSIGGRETFNVISQHCEIRRTQHDTACKASAFWRFRRTRKFRDSAITAFAVNSRNRLRFAEAPNNSRKNADFSVYFSSSSHDSGDAIKYRRTHRL